MEYDDDSAVTTAGEHEEDAAERVRQAEEEALSRAHIPPGIAVVTSPDRGPGAAMAQAAREAAELPGGEDVVAEPDEMRESMDRLAADKPTDVDMAAGLEWLLSDAQEVNTRELRVRAGGSDDAPVWLSWIIRAANTNEIRTAERAGEGNRAQRRGVEAREPDQIAANLRLIVTATMQVNGRKLADLSNAKGHRDPATWLRQRFDYRPGLIPALASQVMDLSGFAENDVRAVGNS
jgi:hypothetical protein